MKQHASDAWADLWRIAGSMNVDPRPLTIRQLFWMTEGRDRHVWSIASALMALIANCHKDSKGRALRPEDFNPTLTRKERLRNAVLITDENVSIMRDEFKKAFGKV